MIDRADRWIIVTWIIAACILIYFASQTDTSKVLLVLRLI